ncbi:hypothetical protein WN944_008152 [Citrus x changshan-huyou]|uniref:Transmembrane protein n=1 Tax=Citrus x changshan-huyou TaxID=2935761 RepID=A0AAP0MTR4_9ROSI
MCHKNTQWRCVIPLGSIFDQITEASQAQAVKRVRTMASQETVKQLEDCSVSKSNVVAVVHTYLDHLTSVMFTVTEMFLHFDDSMRASDYGDFSALKIALGTWVFSVAGALLAIPVGIKRKSLAPLVFFGTTGTMLDIIMGVSACEREHAERQMKLLEAQNAAADASLTETGTET